MRGQLITVGLHLDHERIGLVHQTWVGEPVSARKPGKCEGLRSDTMATEHPKAPRAYWNTKALGEPRTWAESRTTAFWGTHVSSIDGTGTIRETARPRVAEPTMTRKTTKVAARPLVESIGVARWGS